MKKILFVLFLVCNATATLADIKLPLKCEAFMPVKLYQQSVLSETAANEIANSQDYGQAVLPPNGDYKYWVVYSDRARNTTYVGANKESGKHTDLNFNEKVRIAKIQNGFALVYSEPKEGVLYPAISSQAVSKGWIPMENLLLWPTCPANDKGIYNKALITINLDKTQKDSENLGRMYENPDDMSRSKGVQTGMNFYFIMKRSSNGLVLLATEYTMGGASDKVLYGWVDESTYVPWEQRSCLEPNWNAEVVTKFAVNNEMAPIYTDISMQTRYTGYQYGVKFGSDSSEFEYRMPTSILRYPILTNDSGNDDFYKCTTFGLAGSRLDRGMSDINDASKKLEEELKKMQNLNLVVVIDGTSSMAKYFPAVREAIKNGCEYFGTNYIPKVGLVIYRDYTDGEEGCVEYVPMSDPSDLEPTKRLGEYLEKGGKYGITSSSMDRTNEEALYKGLEVALDNQKMGYKKDESNLMLVIGDCGNDENDTKCLSKEQLIDKFVENKINLMVFQIRRNNQLAWLSFNRQMSDFLINNIQTQYTNVFGNLKVRWERCTNGYDLKPAMDVNRQFFIGASRFADVGTDMDPNILSGLMEKNLGDFGRAVQERIDALVKGPQVANITNEMDKNAAKMDEAYMISILGERNYKRLKETRSLLAHTGYTKKHAPDGSDYWSPVIFISHDELTQLMERLSDVYSKTKSLLKSNNRKPYVDAMKALVRSMVPDITNEEMDKKGTGEIMNMITGLNVRSKALDGPRLIDVQDPNVVQREQFQGLLNDFRLKYEKLQSIKDGNYAFKYKSNDVDYYWIPIDELP